MIGRLLTKLFKREDFDRVGKIYLVRWTLIKHKSWSLYLHQFLGDDWALDLHDHPKRFVSVGLKGKYIEETPA